MKQVDILRKKNVVGCLQYLFGDDNNSRHAAKTTAKTK